MWGREGGGGLGRNDVPKRGVSGFHMEAMGPSGEDCLEGNFFPTNYSLFKLHKRE